MEEIAKLHNVLREYRNTTVLDKPILECLDSKFRGSNPNSSWFKVHSRPPGVLSTWISAATPWGRGAPSSWSTNASRTPPTHNFVGWFLRQFTIFCGSKVAKSWERPGGNGVPNQWKIMIKEERHMQLGDLVRWLDGLFGGTINLS